MRQTVSDEKARREDGKIDAGDDRGDRGDRSVVGQRQGSGDQGEHDKVIEEWRSRESTSSDEI